MGKDAVMSNIFTQLNRNPFWRDIKTLLHEFGYEHYTPDQRGSGMYEVRVETTHGPRTYTFARTAALSSTVPNFKAKFRRWLKEDLVARGFLPLPDPTQRERRPGMQMSADQFNTLESQESRRLNQDRQPAVPIAPVVVQPGGNTPAAQAEASPPPAPPQQEQTMNAPVTVTEPKQEKPKDLHITFAVNHEELPTILTLLAGVAELVVAAPAARRPAPAYVAPAPRAPVAPAPQRAPVAALAKKRRRGLRVDEWVLLRMAQRAGEEWDPVELENAIEQAGYMRTSLSPTRTTLEQNGLVTVTGRRGERKMMMTNAGRMMAQRIMRETGMTFDSALRG